MRSTRPAQHIWLHFIYIRFIPRNQPYLSWGVKFKFQTVQSLQGAMRRQRFEIASSLVQRSYYVAARSQHIILRPSHMRKLIYVSLFSFVCQHSFKYLYVFVILRALHGSSHTWPSQELVRRWSCEIYATWPADGQVQSSLVIFPPDSRMVVWRIHPAAPFADGYVRFRVVRGWSCEIWIFARK